MKGRDIFKNDAFIVKNVPCGSEKFTAGKSCNNQRCRRLFAMKNWFYVFFLYERVFRATGYVFDYEGVVFENISLFHVWGTFMDSGLCWKSNFGSVNLLFCGLAFLPFCGLLAAFMAFSLGPMSFSEQLSADWPKSLKGS